MGRCGLAAMLDEKRSQKPFAPTCGGGEWSAEMYLKKSTLPDWQGGWMENETIGLASFNALAQEGWHIQVIGVDNLGAEDS